MIGDNPKHDAKWIMDSHPHAFGIVLDWSKSYTVGDMRSLSNSKYRNRWGIVHDLDSFANNIL